MSTILCSAFCLFVYLAASKAHRYVLWGVRGETYMWIREGGALDIVGGGQITAGHCHLDSSQAFFCPLLTSASVN